MLDNDAKKGLRPVKKSSELRHVSRKACVKIVALELLAQKDSTRMWRDGDMTHWCPAAVPSQSNLTLSGMDMQVVGGVASGSGSSGPSCCLYQLSIKEGGIECCLWVVHSSRDKGGSLRVLLKCYFPHVRVISAQLYNPYLT